MSVPSLTMMKLYPIQSSCQFWGHLGTSMDWLCSASDRVGVSHTEHLREREVGCHLSKAPYYFLCSVLSYLEMYFSMMGPDMGFIIMSMGSAVLSQ